MASDLRDIAFNLEGPRQVEDHARFVEMTFGTANVLAMRGHGKRKVKRFAGLAE